MSTGRRKQRHSNTGKRYRLAFTGRFIEKTVANRNKRELERAIYQHAGEQISNQSGVAVG